MGLRTDMLIETLSVHYTTCRGPNIPSAAIRIWSSPLRNTPVLLFCNVLHVVLPHMNGRRILPV